MDSFFAFRSKKQLMVQSGKLRTSTVLPKRRGKDGDFITHNGKYIFSNTRVVPLKKGQEPKHVLLAADSATSSVENTGDVIVDETGGML
jgi:hypothetical protein